MLEIKNVSKKFIVNNNEINVLNDVNIIFPNKGLFVIKGKSGSGKSTLLNLIAGYDKPTYGKIYYNEVDLCTVNENELSSYQRNEIGFVFQSYNLFDNLTVYENLLFSTDDINENVVDETLTKLEINHLKKRRVKQISGGEKARVAIARALIKTPKIIICDEPTGNLDSKTADEVWNILKKLSSQILVIVASHDTELIKKYADVILTLENGSINYKVENIKKENISLKEKNSKIKVNLFYKKNSFTNLIIGIVLFLLYSLLIICLNSLQINLNKSESYVPKDNNILASLWKRNDTDFVVLSRYNDNDIKNASLYLEKHNIKYDVINEYNNLRLQRDISLHFDFEDPYRFYNILNISKIISKSEKNMDKEYIGRYPKNPNEIMISNFYAKILTMGVMQDDKVYKPKSFEDIINDNYYIKYDGSPYSDVYLKVTGIYMLDYDISEFEKIKVEKNTDNQGLTGIKPNKIMTYFDNNYNTIYVNENFFETLDTKPCTSMDEYSFEFYIKANNEYKLLNFKSNTYYDDNLKDNEIIVNKYILDLLTNNDFSNEFNKQKELNEYDFAIKYMEKHNLLNSIVETKIKDTFGVNGKEGSMETFSLKIVGFLPSYKKDFSITNPYFYVSKNVLEKYIESQREVYTITVYENNPKVLNNAQNYYIKNGFELRTDYTHNFETINKIITNIIPYIWLVCTILVLFIFLFNFMVNIFRISIDKKSIGILKSLGYKNSEIKNLFNNLFLISSFGAILLSVILSFPLNKVINIVLSNYFGFKLRLIFINLLSYLIIFIIFAIVYFLTIRKPLTKITKINVCDILRTKDE